MRYDQLQDRTPADFKRLTGVHPQTFQAMLTALQPLQRGVGRPPKLPLADQLLLTLMYWREYRTQFHIAGTYGVSEATVCRTIVRIEQALLGSGQFRLPGKKALRQPDVTLTVVVLDATESPVERPKKDSDASTAGRRSVTPRRVK
jgi:hypothetical protein